MDQYDIIVIGAGHAGNEAASIAATMGSKVLLVTMNLNTLGQMSCNPAMGGVAKGQIVREIDALGGRSAVVSDRSAIQYRMLNRSKGPAMWSPRSQNDRIQFATAWRYELEQIENLHLYQAQVTGLEIKGEQHFVVNTTGPSFSAKAVILTAGTFLNAQMHVGRQATAGGRMGESSATEMSGNLTHLGFKTERLKTGTPPRIDGRSIDYSKMTRQDGDPEPIQFSFLKHDFDRLPQVPCHITYTNPTVHELLAEGFDESPMFSGDISGTGPRYCPSIEDKITRFAERTRHQIFVEPETLSFSEVYLNGFSTSLPERVQREAIHQIPGLEAARILKPGYAVEYDFFQPTQLYHTLETKEVPNLYFAGQVNGTTGYEEAAGQGLMAGINAHLKLSEQEPFVLKRNEAYIGVLIDDLVTKGTEEPYRMFTSRSEYRLLLRQDNADFRLTPLAHKLGTISDSRFKDFEAKYTAIEKWKTLVTQTSVDPKEMNPYLEEKGSAPINQKVKAEKVLLRPQVHLPELIHASSDLKQLLDTDPVSNEVLESCEIQMKYKGYLEREAQLASKTERMENLKIPTSTDYSKLHNLSTEAKEKLSKVQPQTIAQASRISGISPSDISVLLVHLGR